MMGNGMNIYFINEKIFVQVLRYSVLKKIRRYKNCCRVIVDFYINSKNLLTQSEIDIEADTMVFQLIYIALLGTVLIQVKFI